VLFLGVTELSPIRHRVLGNVPELPWVAEHGSL
jgi:hypothetical protein